MWTPAVECPAGTAGVATGGNNASCSGFCEPGYYCPAGSSSTTAVGCPVGSYNPNPGGTSAATFDPGRRVTRAETITFLWRLAGRPDPVGPGPDFTDVDPSRYYAAAVAWAGSLGITEGTAPGTFGGEEEVTRAQVATFLFRHDQHVLAES